MDEFDEFDGFAGNDIPIPLLFCPFYRLRKAPIRPQR